MQRCLFFFCLFSVGILPHYRSHCESSFNISKKECSIASNISTFFIINESTFISDYVGQKDTIVYESDVVLKDTTIICDKDTSVVHIKKFPNRVVIIHSGINFGDNSVELNIQRKGENFNFIIEKKDFIKLAPNLANEYMTDFGLNKTTKYGWSFYALYCVPETDDCILFEYLINYNGKVKIRIDKSLGDL